MAHPLLARLGDGPVLCDGAMGTLIHARGTPIDACFDELNLSSRETIVEIHREYIAAGADIIETNTFGANRFKLAEHRLEHRVRDINFLGAKLAREARELSGSLVLVAGSVGPTGMAQAPFGLMEPSAVRAAFRDQIGALLEGGVDLLIIETIGSLAEMTEAIGAAREVCDLPIMASMTFADDGRSTMGHSPQEVVNALLGLEVDVVGVNCSVGPRGVLDVLSKMRDAAPSSAFLAGQPNAGWPMQVGDRVIYPSSTDYFGTYVREALDLGVRVVGGCCGTTPDHIAAMRAAIDSHRSTRSRPALVSQRSRSIELIPAEEPTQLSRKLGRQFIVAVELDPPRGLNPSKIVAGARMLKEAGVDAVNVADSPMARVRMGALALCFLVQTEVGVETILHFTTRDRNLMGLQSDLLGAHALGVRNILALTGDPPSLGDYPNATAVYDIDSTGLAAVLSSMNAGNDAAGAPIGMQASFTIAVAADPTRADLAEEADRMHRKVSAGAHFVMTQPIYEMITWRAFLDVYEQRHGPLSVPVMLGILPLHSHRHTEFLYNEVPGIRPTDTIRERMRLAGSQGRVEGIRIAQELLLEARDEVHGVYIMPSFQRYESAAEVMDVVGDRTLTAALPAN
ncbi:MAG TPA: bifunctional homocysteine S-methyltransferase/methylenetetrahydrofolate reductase [Thermomicrobiales bacterium]|nr:bifunctional homocysteine S-methyltransferase/methylenetetrahydrofolate reductase [Thermomicrobiales bacterium]